MLKKTLALFLCLIVLNTVNFAFVSANKTEAARIEKIKAGVSALGTGAEAKINVKLIDDRKLKGYINRIDEDSFTIIEKSGVEKTVSYSDVKKIKGNNLSNGTKILIGVAIAAAIIGVVVAILASRKDDDNRCQIRTQVCCAPCPPGCVCIAQ